MKQVRFVVVEDFRDLEDGNHLYKTGENYPFKGVIVPERAKELASEENKLGKPLLRVVEEVVDFSPLGIEETMTELDEKVQEVAKQLIDQENEKVSKKATKKKVAEGDEGK